MIEEDKRIKVLFEVYFDTQDYDEASELNKKLASRINNGEFLLPLLDEIGEQDYSKWTSYGSTGFVQIEDGGYFSMCSAQLLLNSSVDEEFVYDVN